VVALTRLLWLVTRCRVVNPTRHVGPMPGRMCSQGFRGVVFILGSPFDGSFQRIKRCLSFWRMLRWCHLSTPLVVLLAALPTSAPYYTAIIHKNELKLVYEKGSIDITTPLEYTNSRHTKDSSRTRIEGIIAVNRPLNLLPRIRCNTSFLESLWHCEFQGLSFISKETYGLALPTVITLTTRSNIFNQGDFYGN